MHLILIDFQKLLILHAMLYIIQEKDPPHRIKIGFSKDPHKRIQHITAGASQHMIVLKIMEGDIEDEKWLHTFFSGSRVEGKREWYLPTLELREWIDTDNILPDL
jgi:hypothetical protein